MLSRAFVCALLLALPVLRAAGQGPISAVDAVQLLPAPPHEPSPPERHGLYAVWAKPAVLAKVPKIAGGQAIMQWADAEPSEGRYEFGPLDQQLAELHQHHAAGSVQMNGNNHPAYLFKKVPFTAKKFSTQTLDRAGSLAYWHPAYVAAYLKFLAAFAAHLKSSPYLDAVLGVRMNFNALGTEHTEIPPSDRAPAQWTLPPGVAPAAPWTKEVGARYQHEIVEAFVREFTPEVRVFARNNLVGTEKQDPAWEQLLTSGRLALFHTSSEMEPRGEPGNQYRAFIRYCRSGATTAYAEPWADAEGHHGGKKDPRWCGPAAWNYWRLLSDLNCGVSFIALYGAEVARGDDPAFAEAFAFASRYAGFHASPSVAPGAWVALREGNVLKGDYTFLMHRLPGPEFPPLINVGPPDQRFGAWARKLPKGGEARFELNAAFARSLAGKPSTLHVVYLDEGDGTLTARFAGKSFPIALRHTGRWQTATFLLPKTNFSGVAEVALTSNVDLPLHMLEVTRGSGL